MSPSNITFELGGKTDGWCATNCGSRYGKINQDYGIVSSLMTQTELASSDRQQCFIGAVLDGHGLLGQETSRLAGKALIRFLCNSDLKNRPINEWKQREIQQFMEQSFKWAHLAALATYENPPMETTYPSSSGRSRPNLKLGRRKNQHVYKFQSKNGEEQELLLECGTTCSVAIIEGNTLWVANVGDSTIVLGSQYPSGKVQATQLTVNHNGNNPEEQKRLTCKQNKISIMKDGYIRLEEGDWHGYELAMTRALGHKELYKFGVISQPYVFTKTLKPSDECLIVASDGVWDIYSHQEAVYLVTTLKAQGKSAREAADVLVNTSVQLMQKQGIPADNTTAVVFYLQTNV
eukprot:TRINITY_DN2275_c0_g1_i1.p2 TRINITY_DN2275_c0_g1~~TRINITY_DN2275_c0_g1_i1.p2  ORF type:complete len:348 (-),score=34.41 TRINITY_DN2275_c0_g1_i1:5231-6274(-)